MAVKIRLSRRGRKKLAIYDIVIADARAPRDGRFIEKIGSYNPNTDPSTVVLKNDRAVEWLLNGAQPTDTARSILSHEGIMLKKHLQVGVLKGAITQEQADTKFEDWKQGKEGRKQGTADAKTQQQTAAKQARLDAEKKVNEARAQAIAKKNTVEEPVAEAPAEEAAEAPEAPATEEGEAQE
ncbi:30S ribosomal protein S16 [Larkinella insperata]|uniref:Small ribosomal subunit protein bS16 n=1 Tax=Larkinella insperata TaxID=332158 RepID=A0ABW3QK23_9BACT|nr:30S ribosomal protein S16 [Larkinella insperata]